MVKISQEEFWFPVNIPLEEDVNWSTLVTRYEDGKEQRRKKWSQSKRGFSVSLRGRTKEVMQQVWDFYNARSGAYETFYFENPNENPVTAELFGVGDANQTTFGLDNYPLPSGAITVYNATTNFVETTDYVLTRSSGAVVFNVAPSGDLYATYNFSRIVRFAEDKLTRELFSYQCYNGDVKLIEVL